MPDTTDHADDLLGGRYRLGETLGRGGMADVHRGEDVVLGREVAIKLVRAGTDGVAQDDRARGEVSVLAALNHPSLVTLYDAQLDADAPYLVMELVEGPTLAERIARSPLTPTAAALTGADLAEALHVAHGAGVVHRDVKPSNVLLAPSHLPDHEFRAKLADFGIAYLVDTARVTAPGDVIGTAAYLAPEQVRGLDPAPPADVYALGLVLIESLTGARAFPDAAGVATALARLDAPPQIPAGLDPAWQDLLRDMTRIDPAERPTALDVAIRARALAAAAPADAPTEALSAAAAVAAGAAAAAAPADAATEALLPAGEPTGRGAASPPAPGTAPTSVLPAAAAVQPDAEATRSVEPAPAAQPALEATRAVDPAPSADAPATRRPRRRSRRRATVWITAAAAAALVAGTGGILALTAGGDEVTPADPAPVTDPTPGVRPTGPVAEDEAPDEVDTVSDTDTTDEQETTPTPEETTEAPGEEATPDEGATEPTQETAPTDGATDDGTTDEGTVDDSTVDDSVTDPVEPSPAPVDGAVTEPDPGDSPAPAEPSPAPTG